MNDGRSAGTVDIDQARYLAAEYQLDLVEIGPNASPPVAKLLDYNKYRYQQEKHARGGVKQKNELKEVRLSYSINSHDLETKGKRAKEFLDEGHFVRAYINLRGRENVFPEKAEKNLLAFAELIGAAIDQPVNKTGKKVQIILKANKK